MGKAAHIKLYIENPTSLDLLASLNDSPDNRVIGNLLRKIQVGADYETDCEAATAIHMQGFGQL
jgi:hypothetical protein